MLLSELDIALRIASDNPLKKLIITPIISARHQFGPSSVDVRLGTDFSFLEGMNFSHIDTGEDSQRLNHRVEAYTKHLRLKADDQFFLHPGEFVLASTLEFIKLPIDLAGRIEGRSSWGRLGLLVHATAGYIDPGFSGVLTFELLNAGRVPLALKPGLRVGQICFFQMSNPTKIPYGSKHLSKYSGALTVQNSRIAEDPEIGGRKKT